MMVNADILKTEGVSPLLLRWQPASLEVNICGGAMLIRTAVQNVA